MKKILSLIVSLTALFSFSVANALSHDVKIVIDQTELSADVGAFIENNRTFVPARAVFEKLGVSVEWDADFGTVLMLREQNGEVTSIVLQIGLNKAFVNGNEVELSEPPKIVGNRTFVPLRFVIENFDEKIEWSGEERTVYIETK